MRRQNEKSPWKVDRYQVRSLVKGGFEARIAQISRDRWDWIVRDELSTVTSGSAWTLRSAQLVAEKRLDWLVVNGDPAFGRYIRPTENRPDGYLPN